MCGTTPSPSPRRPCRAWESRDWRRCRVACSRTVERGPHRVQRKPHKAWSDSGCAFLPSPTGNLKIGTPPGGRADGLPRAIPDGHRAAERARQGHPDNPAKDRRAVCGTVHAGSGLTALSTAAALLGPRHHRPAVAGATGLRRPRSAASRVDSLRPIASNQLTGGCVAGGRSGAGTAPRPFSTHHAAVHRSESHFVLETGWFPGGSNSQTANSVDSDSRGGDLVL